MIFSIHICQLRVIMVAPLCCPFELSPLNELYRRKLVRSITLIQMRYYDDIWNTYIPGQDGVSQVRMVSSHCCPIALSSLNEL